MAFTKIVGAGIHTLSNVNTHNINSSGIITATQFVGIFTGTDGDFSGNVTIDGNLTVNGTTTTLDTTLQEVDQLFVSANNGTVGAAITQSGAGDILRLYDGSTQVLKVTDGGRIQVDTAVDQALTLNATDSGPVYTGLQRGGSRIAYYGYGGTGTNFKIANEIQDGDFQIQVNDGGNDFNAFSIDASERKIQLSQKVGVNRSPGFELDVESSNLDADVSFRLYNSQTGSGNDTIIRSLVADNTASNYIYFGDAEDTNIGQIRYSHNNNSLQITVNAQERIRINSSGNVGINSTIPANKLDVANGAAWIYPNENGDEAIALKLGKLEGYTDSLNDILVADDHDRVVNKINRYVANWHFDRTTSPGATRINAFQIKSHMDGSYVGNSFIIRDLKNTADSIKLWTNGDSFIGVTTDGTSRKLGIGTDSPIGKLHIWSTGPDILLTDSNQATDNRNWILTGANTQILRLQAQNDSYSGGGNLFDFYRSGNNINELRGMNAGNYWFVVNNSTKRVGIGTDNPSQILHILDANPIIQFTDTNGLGSRINADSGNLYLDTHNNNRDIIFRGGNSSTDEVARITGNGKVGIGTDSPNTELEVHDEEFANITIHSERTSGNIGGIDFRKGGGSTGIQTAQYFVNTNGEHFFHSQGSEKLKIASDGVITGRGELRLTEGTSSTSNGSEIGSLMYLHPVTNNKNAKIVALQNGGSSGADLAFFTRTQADGTNTDGGEERLRITSTGDVGIGVTNPQYGLDVRSNEGIRIRTQTNGGAGSTGGAVLRFTDQTSAAQQGYIIYKHPDNSITQGSNDGFLIGGSETLSVIKVEGRAVIDEKVGIGTDIPSHELDIESSSPVIEMKDNDAGDSRFQIGQSGAQTYFDMDVGNLGSSSLRFRFAGDEKVRFTTSGRVGIGTVAPARPLHIEDSDCRIRLTESGEDTDVELSNASGNAILTTNGVSELRLQTNNSPRLIVESGGDIKLNQADSIIHTAADTSKLRIFGGSSNSVNNGAVLTLHGVNNSGGNYADLASGTGGYVRFRTGTNERLRIKSDGDVGIGTDNPAVRFHVHGKNETIARFGNVATNEFECISIANNVHGYPAIVQESSGDTLDLRSLGSVQVTLDANNNDNNTKYFRISSNGIGNTAAELFRVHEDGDVGIGTASPEEKLDIRGHVKVDSGPVLESSVSGGVLKITSATGYTEFGSKNTSYAHFGTDRGKYYFDKRIIVNEGIVASYDEDLRFYTDITDERLRIKNDSSGIIQLNIANNSHIRGGVYAKYTGASGDTANINTSSAGKVSWLQTNTEIFENGGFTNTATDVTVPYAGIYQVIFNGYLESPSTARTNVRFRYRINGTDSNEDLSLNNYIRRDSGHNESSVNFIAYLNLSAGDTVAVSSQAVGASGTVTMLKDHSSLTFHLVA